MRDLSIEEYARLVARLSKPFAVPEDELSGAGVTRAEFELAESRFSPALKTDTEARERFVRAYQGGSTGPDPDETMTGLIPLHQQVMPFVEGVWVPPVTPAESRAPKTRSAEGDPDATQMGAVATDVTLPFGKSPLYGPSGGDG